MSALLKALGVRGVLACLLAASTAIALWGWQDSRERRQRAAVALYEASQALRVTAAHIRASEAARDLEYRSAVRGVETRAERALTDCRAAYRAGVAAGRAETSHANCPDPAGAGAVVSLRDLPTFAGEQAASDAPSE